MSRALFFLWKLPAMTDKQRCRVQSFSVQSKREYVLDMLDEMAERERKSKSKIIVRCIEYYYNKKWPGNPQPPLFAPSKPPENEVALQEARLRQAITFLRFKAKLSYRQISNVVDTGKGFVRKLCKGLNHIPNFNGRRMSHKKKRARAFRRNLHRYRERFRQWMDGKFDSVEEAFRW